MTMDVAELYRRYGDLVLGRCRTLLSDEQEARDACQDVFLRLHRYRLGFRGDSAPSTYLFHVTTTTCLNRLRSRKRRKEDLLETFPAAPSLEPRTNDTILGALQLRDLVQRLLADADETTRLILLYHFADGMTHEEVGNLVGLSAAAVRKRIARFRATLEEAPPPWLAEAVP